MKCVFVLRFIMRILMVSVCTIVSGFFVDWLACDTTYYWYLSYSLEVHC